MTAVSICGNQTNLRSRQFIIVVFIGNKIQSVIKKCHIVDIDTLGQSLNIQFFHFVNILLGSIITAGTCWTVTAITAIAAAPFTTGSQSQCHGCTKQQT